MSFFESPIAGERQQPQGPVARLASVDALRGLAILGVVAIHTSAHFQYVPGVSALVIANLAVDAFTHYAVPLFVLLSGLTLSRRYPRPGSWREAREFYRRRLNTLVPPYLLFSLVYLALFAFQYGPPAPGWVILSILSGNAYYHLWFVAMLIQFYLLYPPLAGLVERADGRARGVVLLLVALLMQWGWNLGTPLLADVLPDRPLVDTVLSNRVFLSHIFYFLLGILAGRHAEGFERKVKALRLFPLTILALALTAAITWVWVTAIARYGSLEGAPAIHFAAATIFEPALYLATIAVLWSMVGERDAGGETGILAALYELGTLSFGIYLVHVLFQWMLVRAFAPLGLTPAGWPFYPALFLGTLLLSYASVRLLARLPFGRRIVGVTARS